MESRQAITDKIRQRVPKLMAIYAFGSRIQGMANAASDLDLSVLVEGYADTIRLFEISSELADVAQCDVDLLDFRAASTVMQYQILTTGQRWWARDWQASNYEIFVFREKYDLDVRRADLMADIVTRGRVFGSDVGASNGG